MYFSLAFLPPQWRKQLIAELVRSIHFPQLGLGAFTASTQYTASKPTYRLITSKPKFKRTGESDRARTKGDHAIEWRNTSVQVASLRFSEHCDVRKSAIRTLEHRLSKWSGQADVSTVGLESGGSEEWRRRMQQQQLGKRRVSQSRQSRRSSRVTSASRRSRVDAVAVPVKPAPSAEGSEEGSEEVNVRSASASTARGLVHRYVTALRANARQGSANSKTRAEVSGGGKKPYKQKGTGNARQGSIRTPLKVGGGVVFGPKPRDWSERMNRKEKRLAVSTALQNAAENGALLSVNDLSEADFPQPSTKQFTRMLGSFGVGANESVLFVTNASQLKNVRLSARNVPNVKMMPVSTLNAYDLVRADVVIVERSALQNIQDFYKEGGTAWRPLGSHARGTPAPAEAA